MKKTVLTLTVLAFFAFTAGNVLAQSAEDAKFNKFKDTFWDAYFKLFPTTGTLQGYTKYNDKLEDLSQATIEKFLEGIDVFNQELVSKIDKFKLSPDLQLEHEIMRDFLDLTQLKLEDSLFLIDNPLYYNELFVNSIRSLIVRNPGAPAAASRAKLLPGLIKRAKDNLKTPPQEYTQAAVRQMPGIIEFYKTDVPKLAGANSGLQAETQKIIMALDDYQRFLQNELMPKSTGNFRNPEAHIKVLRYTTQGNLSIQQDIVARSTADASNIRREMLLVAAPFYKIMYPDVNVEQIGANMAEKTARDEHVRRTIIQGVLEKIKVDHVAKEEYVGRISQSAANIKNFIQQTKLFDLPADDLKIEPMSEALTWNGWFLLDGPGAFETTGPYTLYVRPIPSDWPPEQVSGFLEEHNNYYIDFMTVQRVYPGSFVPTYFAWKDPSAVKKMAANQALLRGWPIYIEEMMIKAGYGNFDLRMRLNQLKLLLKTVIDFQMDMNVHEGTYAKEKVVDYMARGGFMTPVEAEKRWNQIVTSPGEASLAYIGYQELLELEKDYRTLKGNAFSQKDFLQKLLSYGPIPLRTLKTKLAQ
ncbi:MAG TPA: DUF885 family protein [Burkholderiales bacterium]|nr:DUF885 family protein [Burkholderiales bacterium]